MTLDKNKIIESATKFVQRGQYDKAIKEYAKLLEADPKDARIQQKLGELYQKRGDNGLAADCFVKVAESYAADGFFLKAVAVFKQVLKLNPALVEVNLKLAELHHQLGLVGEAMAQLQVVAAHYEKAGDARGGMETLRKMVDFDPDNVVSRIKLAELYAKEGKTAEAVGEFGRAADYLKRNNRNEDYAKVAERLIFLDPNNLEATRELAAVYLEAHDAKRAVAKLQVCFKADPEDVGTLSLLARAFGELGQTAKTVSVYKELAKIHASRGQEDEEREVWRKILELAPDDADARARYPEGIGGAAGGGDAGGDGAAAPSLSPDQIPRLLTETDVYVKYGLYDKAIEHLDKVFAISPDSIDGHEKAADLYEASGDVAKANATLVKVVRLCLDQGEPERARISAQKLGARDPSNPELPGLLEAIEGSASQVAELEPDEIVEEAAEAPLDAEAIGGASGTPEPPANDPALEDAALEAAAEPSVSEEIVADPESEIPASPGGDDDLALAGAQEGDEVVEPDSEPVVEGEALEEAESLEDGPPEPELDARPTFPNLQPIRPGPARGDPFAAAAAAAPAPPADDRGDPASPRTEEIVEAREPVTGRVEGDVVKEPVTGPVEGEPPKEPITGPVEGEPAQDELEEASFFVEQGMLDEAAELLGTILVAFPRSKRAQELMARVEQARAAAPVAPAEELPVATSGVYELDGSAEAEELESDEFQYTVQEVFAEFKEGLKAVVKPEDVSTHYDLGIAYKEMGLFKDAIGEFGQAAAGAAGTPKELDCLAMIAACRAAANDLKAAEAAYERALSLPHVTPESAKALHFELAQTLEKMGRPQDAFKHYAETERIDPSFRGVSSAVARLKGSAGDGGPSSPDGGPSKPRKIGYM